MLNLLTLTSLVVFLYSYGFIDLNLTLYSHPLFLSITKNLQHIPYFNRPLSTYIYIGIIVILFSIYIHTMRRPHSIFPWRKIALIGVIFTLSYPFLSHDVFKYLFSARMVVDYGLNPHTTSPDQIPGDLWLRFLRWTHTPSPYGPVFTLLTIPSYILGLRKFTLTFYIFKLFNFLFYLLAIATIGRISTTLKFSKTQIVNNQLLFAINPLVLIELLSNSHNDLMMFSLFLLSILLYFSSRKFASAIALAFSVGVKYVTLILAPFYLIKIDRHKLIDFLAVFFLIAPILYYRQYQPWYISWFVTIAALSRNITYRNLALLFSISALLKYIPYIYSGLWSASPTTFAIYSFALPIIYLIYIWIRPLRLI